MVFSHMHITFRSCFKGKVYIVPHSIQNKCDFVTKYIYIWKNLFIFLQIFGKAIETFGKPQNLPRIGRLGVTYIVFTYCKGKTDLGLASYKC